MTCPRSHSESVVKPNPASHTYQPTSHKAVSLPPPPFWHHLLSLQALLSLQWNIPAHRGLKEQGWNAKSPCPLAIAFLLSGAQQTLAQEKPTAHVQPWAVRTNFNPHARDCPHTAVCQVKPPKQVLCGGGTAEFGCCPGVLLGQLCQCALPSSVEPWETLGQAWCEARPSVSVQRQGSMSGSVEKRSRCLCPVDL